MSGIGTPTLCGHDRAVLRAVAAGRCQLGAECEPVLLVDGMACADSSAGYRLVSAGWLSPPAMARPFRLAALTVSGHAALATAS